MLNGFVLVQRLGWVGLQLDPWYDLRLLEASKSVLSSCGSHTPDACVKTKNCLQFPPFISWPSSTLHWIGPLSLLIWCIGWYAFFWALCIGLQFILTHFKLVQTSIGLQFNLTHFKLVQTSITKIKHRLASQRKWDQT